MAQSTDNNESRQSANSRNASEGKGSNSDSARAQQRQRTLDYWTDERMRDATPVELPKADPNDVRRKVPK
jgi:hypothetical protein